MNGQSDEKIFIDIGMYYIYKKYYKGDEMNQSRKLNKTASIKVNDEIWMEFKKNSRELLGTSASSALLYLMQMFNLQGNSEGITDIVMEAITPVMRKAVEAKGKEISAVKPEIEKEVKIRIKEVKGKKK